MPIFGKEGPPGDTHSHGDLYVEYAVVLPQEVDGRLRGSEWIFLCFLFSFRARGRILIWGERKKKRIGC